MIDSVKMLITIPGSSDVVRSRWMGVRRTIPQAGGRDVPHAQQRRRYSRRAHDPQSIRDDARTPGGPHASASPARQHQEPTEEIDQRAAVASQ
jgi:hypothetical protein